MCENENGMREEWIERQMKKTSAGKEIEIIHIIFLVIAVKPVQARSMNY